MPRKQSKENRINRSLNDLPLESISALCGRLGGRHISVIGSAARKPIDQVGDIDLYVVIPRMDRSAFAELFAAAETTAGALAGQAGRRPLLELRHGPFKPSPDAGNVLQLHLLIDDEASLKRSPLVLRARRAATGHLIAGSTLETLAPIWGSLEDRICEARVELTRWREALLAREIAFRQWVFDPDPHLAEGRIGAKTAWDLRCLLRGAAAASDLHYQAISERPGASFAAGDLPGPFLTQIVDPNCRWQDLDGLWDQIRSRAIAILDRRIEGLPQT